MHSKVSEINKVQLPLFPLHQRKKRSKIINKEEPSNTADRPPHAISRTKQLKLIKSIRRNDKTSEKRHTRKARPERIRNKTEEEKTKKHTHSKHNRNSNNNDNNNNDDLPH